jgi:membrane protein YqaA with SNARE-associated domain
MVLFFLLLANWIDLTIRFGWAGIIGIGILDASVVPLPGSLDLLTVVLAARNHEYWPLYAASAWIGSVGGSYFTFEIGQKGGKELLERKVPRRVLRRVSKWTEEHSSLALFLPTLLPPPAPMSYFVLAAGATQISLRTFFLSFGTGRAIRYVLLAYFSTRYSDQIISWARQNYTNILYGLLSLAALGGIVFAAWWFKRRQSRTV